MEKFGNNIGGGRLGEDEAFLAQQIATKEEGIHFSEKASNESYHLAEELIEELEESGLSLEGVDWTLIRGAQGSDEIMKVLKEYAISKGVDSAKMNEYIEETGSETNGFPRIKNFAFMVALLVGIAGGATSEAHAAPLLDGNHAQTFSKEQMADMKDAVIFGEEEITGYQEEYQDYINELKHANSSIADIKISHARVSQKVINENGHITPAVVLEVELKVKNKDGKEIILHDMSYKNINTGYKNSNSKVASVFEFAAKKGWTSAESVGFSGAWKKDLRNSHKEKLTRESMERLGEQIRGMR